ncbi:hypothetical protein POPTR_016G115250v4 [Populus trichocarpa]|uniref:Uncharacterized protein n=1 Tax=Populus trichocarpa TaxID=3694 RepID=A0ACC0RUF8_POPTR|nr:hypothetical protein BDE02_16G103000 [Populus trichocarpa]KAI9380557.1 hypothetical protein POPTR_016G115250v4 [Populus trichocarpa]
MFFRTYLLSSWPFLFIYARSHDKMLGLKRTIDSRRKLC